MSYIRYYKHNVFIVSHKIMKSNRQTPHMGANKPPHLTLNMRESF